MNKKHLLCGVGSLSLLVSLNNMENVKAFENETIYLNKELKTSEDIVFIEDKNLLKAINNQLGRGEVMDSVTVADMESLTVLNANNRNISSIEGLEYAINLTTLFLYNNQISDISALENLTSLKDLRVFNNQISDMSAIANLSKLSRLEIFNNQIVDISALENLTDLMHLYLNNNQISDISVLENLTNLTHLYLNNNQISDISVLENLTNLIFLYLNNNQISDISVLENLTNLMYLYLNDNQISDISALENLTSLKDLRLSNNQISDISALENLTSLTTLELYINRVLDISSLENLTSLTYLHLGNNQISDISALENLTSLKDLRAFNNRISDISAIASLSKLTRLEIFNNQISDISALENLTDLIHLYLNNNQIVDISVLENLTDLIHLYLNNNQISEISVLENLTDLMYLYLNDNQISDVSPIRNLNNLTVLNLSNQRPIIKVGDFKSEANEFNVFVDNPIMGLNNKVSNITNISNNGLFEKGSLKWNNVSLGNHTRTFNFSENVTIGSATATFSGTATLNFNVVDGYAPESDHTSEFDNNDFGIYTIVTATDLGEGVSHLIHKGVRHSLPYRFKYDVYDNSSNMVEVYDLAGNKADYEVKLKDSDIPTIEEGLDALIVKDNIKKEDISYFRTIINDLDESLNKDLLQDRLNNIFPNSFELERKSATGNLDVYIKSQNMLSMSLNTNSVTFDGYSGTEDMEMLGVVNISINSSLPYSLNAYMPNEIANADKLEVLPTDILNIRDESEGVYQTFANTTDKVVLKDNCAKGNDLVHSIDLKLSSNLAHKADVYKTVIKFEAEQK